MSANNHHGPALPTLLRQAASAGFGLLQNRGELFLMEAQEKNSRLIRLLICGLGTLFLGMTTLLLVTGIAWWHRCSAASAASPGNGWAHWRLSGGWQLYRRFKTPSATSAHSEPPADKTAAEEYLEKRI